MPKINQCDTYRCPACDDDRFLQIQSEAILSGKAATPKYTYSQCIVCGEFWVNPSQQKCNEIVAKAFLKVKRIMSIECG